MKSLLYHIAGGSSREGQSLPLPSFSEGSRTLFDYLNFEINDSDGRGQNYAKFSRGMNCPLGLPAVTCLDFLSLFALQSSLFHSIIFVLISII